MDNFCELKDEEIDKFFDGSHISLYKILGAHKKKIEDIEGVLFRVWAPRAKSVCVIGQFNNWNNEAHVLENIKNSGIWQIFIPSIKKSQLYKYEITSSQDEILIKTDPFAFYTELRPHNSGIIYDVDEYKWNDKKWMKERKKRTLSRPINIYEVHLQSWIKGNSYFFNYIELAHKLVSYLKKMGFNYIELLPLMEHPLDDSWGYQLTGYFSITSRYGTPKDFQYFVDYMHYNDIGVILDWVPGHFCVDDCALAKFDGSYLYESRDLHPEWKTKLFDFRKKEVRSFLISSACFFLDKYHVDGLRMDAISSMIYLDHARKNNNWEISKCSENKNLDAIEFIKLLNSKIHENYPDVITIAEEATAFKNVTNENGLGFDLKWNMGWIYDTLSYFQTSFERRKEKHEYLAFSIVYAFNEKFMLSFSHDEMSIENKSILERMPTSDDIEKIANLKLFYSYMMCQPGKKLSFMGLEFANEKKWNNAKHLPWELLKNPLNKKFHNFVKDLNHLYLKKKAFWEDDFTSNGFSCIDYSDKKNSCISYLRKSKNSKILCIHNFSNNYLKNYFINVENLKAIKQIFNTNLKKYGGAEKGASTVKISENGLYLDIAAFTTLIYEVNFDS
jgi:1,4-alpha-glucan branching enzyme